MKNNQDDWSNGTEVEVEEQKICAACDQPFTPKGFWEKRCEECRRNNIPRKTEILNPNFTGQRELPKGMRTYDAGNGQRYPSVTTIIHPEGIDFPPDQLAQYAARGTIIHKKIEHHLTTGYYPTLKELCELYPDMVPLMRTLKDGNLKLRHQDCNWLGFYNAYKELCTFDETEVKLVNHEHKYAGSTDIIGTFCGEKAIFDNKTAGSYAQEKLDDYFMQTSAYAKACGLDIKYLVIIPLNPKSKQGFDEPLHTDKVDYYFKKFLAKRRLFTERYGI